VEALEVAGRRRLQPRRSHAQEELGLQERTQSGFCGHPLNSVALNFRAKGVLPLIAVLSLWKCLQNSRCFSDLQPGIAATGLISPLLISVMIRLIV
jgi:hypothetical protein